MRALLIKGLNELGIEASEQQLTQLLTYTRAIEKGNAQVNLVKATEKELIINHLLDTLAGLKPISGLWTAYTQGAPAQPVPPAGGRIADLGSGAGLPGIPLALFMPEARFTLIENSPRKAAFLKNMAAVLNLPHVEVLNQDIESVTALYPLIVFRAFTPLQKAVFQAVYDRLAPHGKLLAYKGRAATIDAELAGLNPHIKAGVQIEIIPVHVPFLDKERHLLVLSKIN